MTAPGLSGSEHWTQGDENIFIRNLGTHYQPGMHRTRVTYSRADALRGYLLGLERRTAWGALDQLECRRIAEEELSSCQSEEPSA